MLSLEDVLIFAGSIYVLSTLFGLLLNIKDAIYAFVLPRFFAPVNFVEKYGQWAIVTGCTQGIGRCYAEELAKRGMSMVLISRNKSKLDDLATHLGSLYGVATKVIVADFTKPEALSIILSKLDEFEIEIGVLVNNVGILGEHHMPFLELDRNTVINMINVNVTSGTVLCHHLLPKMKERGKGAIINLSSSASLIYIPYVAEYTATKHYMTAFTRALAAEYSEYGVTIQSMEPGQVDTEMTKHFEKVGTFVAPTPDAYVNQAILTLGYTDKTCGYWPHSLLLGFFMARIVRPLLGDYFVLPLLKRTGEKVYKNALLEKQKMK